MSSRKAAFTFPVPVANVVPAAYPVAIELVVSGVDGAATVSLNAHNFGFGPLQSGACRDEATKLINAMAAILQAWAMQAARAQAVPPAGNPGL
jgi:hypothetical protein